jgi:hypothetical protein
MEYSDSKQVIGRWVENTLQMKTTDTIDDEEYGLGELRISYATTGNLRIPFN